MNNLFTSRIVSSEKIIVHDDGLEISTKCHKTGFCPLKEISDIDIGNIEYFFSTFASYRFKIIRVDENGNYVFSYKKCHPMLYTNKHKIVSTVSHFRNLKKFVWDDIEKYIE